MQIKYKKNYGTYLDRLKIISPISYEKRIYSILKFEQNYYLIHFLTSCFNLSLLFRW